MPPPLTQTQNDIIKTMLQAKTPYKKIMEAANCHISQVKRMARNLKNFGNVKAPKLKKQGRPCTITQEAIEVYQYPLFFECLIKTNFMKGLREYLQEQSFSYHDEMVAFLYDEYNISTSLSVVGRALKRAKISRKKVSISMLLFLEISDC